MEAFIESPNENFLFHKVSEIFGNDYRIQSIERLLGGAQKHTWLVRCTNGFAFVVYWWGENTSYFSDSESDLFSSSSAELFELNWKFMNTHGILLPKLYHIDRTRREQPYDYAFVEYIDGSDFDEILVKEPERIPEVTASLHQSIRRLHSIRSPQAGQLGHLLSADFDYPAYALLNLKKDIAYLLAYDKEYASRYAEAEKRLDGLASRLKPRAEYTFVHFELGPNHVMVDKRNNAYLIDIEGARFCDVEEEASFLELRFGQNVPKTDESVDEERMLFYRIGHCIGNLRGAVELRESDYYDMDDVNGMIAFFHGQIQTLLN